VHLTVPEANEDLRRQIRAPDSPLKNLLLFIMKRGQKINPREGEEFAPELETHLELLRKHFAET